MKPEDINPEGWWKKHGLVTGARFNTRLTLYGFKTLEEHFKGESCLELGCASGLWTEMLVRRFKRVVAVDGDPEMYQETKNRIKSDNLEMVLSLFEEYDTSEKFNTIIMAHILEHIENPVLILKRAKTWLESDGVILICVPNADSLHRRAGVKMGLLKMVSQLNEVDKAIGHKRVFTWETLQEAIREASLKAKRMGGIFLKPLTNAQIEDWFTEEMMEGFYELGKEYPEIAAEIYAVCEK